MSLDKIEVKPRVSYTLTGSLQGSSFTTQPYADPHSAYKAASQLRGADISYTIRAHLVYEANGIMPHFASQEVSRDELFRITQSASPSNLFESRYLPRSFFGQEGSTPVV